MYIVPAIGGTQLVDVDGSMLDALYGHLLASGRSDGRDTPHGAGPSPKTVSNVHGVLVKAFRDGVQWDGCSGTRAMPPIHREGRRQK